MDQIHIPRPLLLESLQDRGLIHELVKGAIIIPSIDFVVRGIHIDNLDRHNLTRRTVFARENGSWCQSQVACNEDSLSLEPTF